ncbi:MAG: leucine-rich repeat domain-containing protein [Paramuribaculum sp.]|nr:leucine-rich repeat domain-containing protein [Paramuribaculum sp.]
MIRKVVLIVAAGAASTGTVTAEVGDTFTLDRLTYTVTSESTPAVKAMASDTHISGEVVIPSSVSNAGKDYAVTAIATSAFNNCVSITSVAIANSVKSIGAGSFSGCSALISATLPTGISSIGNNTFYNCFSLESMIIPEGVTSIGSNAFFDCHSMTSVTLPTTLKSIGTDGLNRCSALTKIDIPEGVTTISNYAFFGCTELTSITFPASLTSYGTGVLSYCKSLKEINVAPDNKILVSVDGVLYNKEITTLLQYPLARVSAVYEIPEGVTTLSANAFMGNHTLESMIVPKDVANINFGVFADCSAMKSIDVAEANENYKSVDGVVYSKDETTLVAYPAGRNGKYEILPATTEILRSCFRECKGLTAITIPEGIASLGNYVFFGCENLTTITDLNPVPPTIGTQVFDSVPASAVVYVPDGSSDAYAQAWPMFTDFRTIADASIDTIRADEESEIDFANPYVVYNASGIIVGDDIDTLEPGIYIVGQGVKSKKIVVK